MDECQAVTSNRRLRQFGSYPLTRLCVAAIFKHALLGLAIGLLLRK
jgi:hypothetical protein